MALMQCPECGQMVSDRAKECVHCGAPFVKNVVTIQAPTDTTNTETTVRLTYVITDDRTGRRLLVLKRNESGSRELDEPTTLRCHQESTAARAFGDATVDYVPNGARRFVITEVDPISDPHLSFVEVDSGD